MMTRREALQGLGLAIGAALIWPSLPAFAQQSFSPDELAAPGPLGDMAQGPADAKVTIIEYASLTCSHCAEFHKGTYPALKERYIDTGKVRYILREFPFDPLATAGFMLARCDNGEKYYPVVDLLFQQQRNWALTNRPLDALMQTMRQAGYSKEKFEACLNDTKTLSGIEAVRNRAMEKFKVESTPTFFINGKKYSGNMSIDEMEKILKPLGV